MRSRPRSRRSTSSGTAGDRRADRAEQDPFLRRIRVQQPRHREDHRPARHEPLRDGAERDLSAGAGNHLADAKINHRINQRHQASVRYAYDDQKLLRTQNVSSDSNQIDEYSRTHSIVADESWIVSQRMVNTIRFHYLNQNVGNTPYSFDLSVSRPSVTTGQSGISPQFFPRTRKVISDTLYINAADHDLKFGRTWPSPRRSSSRTSTSTAGSTSPRTRRSSTTTLQRGPFRSSSASQGCAPTNQSKSRCSLRIPGGWPTV